MEQKTKFIIIGLAGFAIVFFLLFIQAQGVKQQLIRDKEVLKEEKVTLENGINKLKSDAHDYEKKLNSLSAGMDEISSEKDGLQKAIDSITSELEEEKNAKALLEQRFEVLKNDNKILTRQLSKLNEQKNDLEKKFQDSQKEKIKVEQSFEGEEQIIPSPVAQVDNLKEQPDVIQSAPGPRIPKAEEVRDGIKAIELSPIVVRPSAEPEAREIPVVPVRGKVLAINKESNFVIINLGFDAGAKVGDIFRVYREDQLIASLEVIQTRSNIAACDIKREMFPVKIGDVVR